MASLRCLTCFLEGWDNRESGNRRNAWNPGLPPQLYPASVPLILSHWYIPGRLATRDDPEARRPAVELFYNV